jgi:Tol biopolymer transport system component
MNDDGTNEKSLFSELVNFGFLDDSAQKVYFTSRNQDLYVVNVDGGNLQKIQEKVLQPDLSPDGKYLVYQKLNADWEVGQYSDRALGITVLDLQTGGEKRISQSWEDFNSFWTPDGKKILFFSRSPEGLASHFIMDVDGNNRKQLTNFGEMFITERVVPIPSERPIWSANGRYLVYESDREIWVNKFSDNYNNLIEAKQLAYGRDPQWLVDGKSITVVVNNSNIINQALITIDIDDGSITN